VIVSNSVASPPPSQPVATSSLVPEKGSGLGRTRQPPPKSTSEKKPKAKGQRDYGAWLVRCGGLMFVGVYAIEQRINMSKEEILEILDSSLRNLQTAVEKLARDGMNDRDCMNDLTSIRSLAASVPPRGAAPISIHKWNGAHWERRVVTKRDRLPYGEVPSPIAAADLDAAVSPPMPVMLPAAALARSEAATPEPRPVIEVSTAANVAASADGPILAALAEIRQDLQRQNVKMDRQNAELRQEIQHQNAELSAKMDRQNADVRRDIAKVNEELNRGEAIAAATSAGLYIRSGSGSCNGALLNGELVLTAAHCTSTDKYDTLCWNPTLQSPAIEVLRYQATSSTMPTGAVATEIWKFEGDAVALKFSTSHDLGPVRPVWPQLVPGPFAAARSTVATVVHDKDSKAFVRACSVLESNGEGLYQGPGRRGHSGSGIFAPGGALVGLVSKATAPLNAEQQGAL